MNTETQETPEYCRATGLVQFKGLFLCKEDLIAINKAVEALKGMNSRQFNFQINIQDTVYENEVAITYVDIKSLINWVSDNNHKVSSREEFTR